MSHTCEITDQYLDKLYDDCLREEARLLSDLRNCSDIADVNDRDIQRQGQMLHTIAQTALKLKIFRQKSRAKNI
jgi:hypothetical protein